LRPWVLLSQRPQHIGALKILKNGVSGPDPVRRSARPSGRSPGGDEKHSGYRGHRAPTCRSKRALDVSLPAAHDIADFAQLSLGRSFQPDRRISKLAEAPKTTGVRAAHPAFGLS